MKNGTLSQMIATSKDWQTLQPTTQVLGVSPLPQSGDTQAVLSHVQGVVVPRSVNDPEFAWQFLRFLVRPEIQKRIIEAEKVTPSRLDLVQEYLNHDQLGVFARQAKTSTPVNSLISKSKLETTINTFSSPFNSADLKSAQETINQTLKTQSVIRKSIQKK